MSASRYKKVSIKKERIDFERAYRDLRELQRRLILAFKGLTEFRQEWISKKTFAFCVREPNEEEWQALFVSIHERKWYCSRSKALEHISGTRRAVKKFKRKIKNVSVETYAFIGNYTRSVKGRGVKRKGLSRYTKGTFFFPPNRAWVSMIVNFLYNMLTSRLRKIIEGLERRGMSRESAYGVVRRTIEVLEEVLTRWRSLLLLDELA